MNYGNFLYDERKIRSNSNKKNEKRVQTLITKMKITVNFYLKKYQLVKIEFKKYSLSS